MCSRTKSTSSGLRTKLQRDEVDAHLDAGAQVLEVLLGHRGQLSAGPGMFRPWREATVPPTSTRASISPSPPRTAVVRSRTAPSAR